MTKEGLSFQQLTQGYQDVKTNLALSWSAISAYSNVDRKTDSNHVMNLSADAIPHNLIIIHSIRLVIKMLLYLDVHAKPPSVGYQCQDRVQQNKMVD